MLDIETRQHIVRRGVAKRADNFEDTCSLASSLPPDFAESSIAVADAIRCSLTGRISANCILLLIELVSCLAITSNKLTAAKTHVWPANDYLSARLALKVRTIQKLNEQLEEAGLIIRCYSASNRRKAYAGIDLSPVLALYASGMLQEWRRQKRTALHEARAARRADAEAGAEREYARVASNDSSKDESEYSPSFAFVHPDMSNAPAENINLKTEDQVSTTALLGKKEVKLCPALLGVLQNGTSLLEAGIALLPGRYPEYGNRLVRLWTEAVERRGDDAVKALIILLENDRLGDLAVKSPAGWLKYYASPEADEIDWSRCINRLAGIKPPSSSASIVSDSYDGSSLDLAHLDPDWANILRRIASIRGVSMVKAWLLGLQFDGIRDDVLRLRTKSSFAKDWIMREFADVLRQTAGVGRVEIRCSH